MEDLDDSQIKDNGPQPGEEFSFQPRVDDTVSDNSMSQTSFRSGRPAASDPPLLKACPDCGYTGRSPSEVRRHRGKEDNCALDRMERRNKKKQ